MKPKITIGIPVYNGSIHIKNRLEGILNQSFSNFEVIISDNASTDMTQEICKEFERKDSRIKYIRQEENHESTLNFIYVLNQAQSEYFVWAAADDIWKESFLEKNINALNSNCNIVGSTGKIEMYGPIFESFKSTNKDDLFQKIYKKIRCSFRYMNTRPISGTYEQRIRKYLKNPGHNSLFFSIFRTNYLKKSIVENAFPGTDFAFVLNVLKYGELNVINEVLMYKFEGGMSGKGMKNLLKQKEFQGSIITRIFPHQPFTKWCIKNLKMKIFLKNMDCFIKINFEGVFSVIIFNLKK